MSVKWGSKGPGRGTAVGPARRGHCDTLLYDNDAKAGIKRQ